MQTLTDLLQSLPQWGAKPALVYRTGVRRFVCSYEKLYRLALSMNSWLAEQGVDRGDRVLVWGPNSPAWAITFWGCIARGAVPVPVDFMSGGDRAATLAALTGAKLVLQSRFKAEQLPVQRTVMLEDLEYLLDGVEPVPRPETASPDDTAQLIYTSGTTGNPKGVVLTHRNLVANLRQVNDHIPIVTSDYTFLSLLPLSHMFEQTGGFLTPLNRGATIVYLRTLKPSAIMEALREEDIYAIIAVPRLLRLLRGSVEREFAQWRMSRLLRGMLRLGETIPVSGRKLLFCPVQKKFGRHFTLFVSGGAALALEDFRFWNAMGFTVLEGYGLTECAPVIAANTMARQVAGSVGKVLPGVAVRIANNEIVVRGDNVFPGYYGNEQATRESFTPDGWFRTGDLGEMDRDAYLYIKGRSKELIVTAAGVNVYPDEIENILNTVPGVRESCVIGLDRGQGEEVHAVFLLDGSGRGMEDIVAEANSRLDALQQITGFSLWPDAEFPKTTTLKIRKFQVKERLREGRALPSAATSDPLAALVARVTGTRAEAVREDARLAADLGLTSIGRLELVNSIEQEFRLDLEETAIGQETTLAELRRMIAARDKIRVGRRLRYWTNGSLFRSLRKLLDCLLHYPLFRPFVTLETVGLENLAGVRPPVLFIANHLSYFDYPAIMFSLPAAWRYWTATAAWEEFFFPRTASLPMKLWKRFAYDYGTMVLNLFPLPQTGGFRDSLRYMGKLVDHGRNILVFPEGQRSPDGRLLPFQQGLGVIARELLVPVVPVHISGMEKIFARGMSWPVRGKATVSFGLPLYPGRETPEELVEKARRAVVAAGESARSGV